ncbi:MAG TPA: hypothetical protein VL092_02965 [Chitinophagaceae bacterium]|nr:hypothetical protein [Chitinophagaceae bacterium]
MIKGLTRNLLYLLLIGILLLPLVQKRLHLFPEPQLSGAVETAPNTGLSTETWWDGSYQEKKSLYANDNIGFRPWLIKINNQVDYSLLRKVHTREVVIGKNYCLFEKGYIEKRCGSDYKGVDESRQKLHKLKALQDTFKQMGKSILLVHAPSKAWYYPEYVPDHMVCDTTVPSRYKDFLRLEDSLQINRIDFNAWFVAQKDTTKHLLMSMQGIHWTTYAALLAADSIISWHEKYFHKPIPHIRIEKLESTSNPNGDDDIARGLNLFLPVTRETFTYPTFSYTEMPMDQRLNAFYMGDSFFWTMINIHLPHQTNNDFLFWYSWGEIWYRKDGVEDHSYDDELDWKSTLAHTDMIVLMATEVNLDRIGNGFIEKAYAHYFGSQR